jgi:hypothetical protein
MVVMLVVKGSCANSVLYGELLPPQTIFAIVDLTKVLTTHQVMVL